MSIARGDNPYYIFFIYHFIIYFQYLILCKTKWLLYLSSILCKHHNYEKCITIHYNITLKICIYECVRSLSMDNVTVSYGVGVSNSHNNRGEKISRENIPLKNVQWGSSAKVGLSDFFQSKWFHDSMYYVSYYPSSNNVQLESPRRLRRQKAMHLKIKMGIKKLCTSHQNGKIQAFRFSFLLVT